MMRPDIEGIRKRAEAATKGPWEYGRVERQVRPYCERPRKNKYGSLILRPGLLTLHVQMAEGGGELYDVEENGWFIAAARTDIPAMLDYIDELEKRLASAEAEGGE